jgi:tetratricopeptide (TPR) repeat protein
MWLKRGLWSGLLLLVGWCAVARAERAPAEFDAVQRRIQVAFHTRDLAAIRHIRDELADAEDSDLLGYYRAYSSYRIGELSAADKKAAKTALNECINELKAVVTRNPQMAEAFALQATCYGASAQYYMLRAATRGVASGKALERALELGPENPRVIFQDALGYYSRPGAFGGDKDKALQRFLEAAARFQAAPDRSLGWPAWGEAESYLYIGRLEAAAGRAEQARAAFQKGLELAPGYLDVQEALAALP